MSSCSPSILGLTGLVLLQEAPSLPMCHPAPDPVLLLVLDGVGEALLEDRALGADAFRAPDLDRCERGAMALSLPEVLLSEEVLLGVVLAQRVLVPLRTGQPPPLGVALIAR